MSAKKYATAAQRSILAMAGIDHVSGRSFKEAEALIDENIRRRNLPNNVRDQASARQRAKLDEVGFVYSEDISKADAAKIIEQHKPATEKQIQFLHGLHAEIPANLTKQAASELIDKYTQIRPMSQGQARFIAELGGIVDRSMTYKNAGEFIELLLEQELNCARCGVCLDRRSERCVCGAFAPKRNPIRPPGHLLLQRSQKVQPQSAVQRMGSTSQIEKQPYQLSILARILNWLGLG